MTSLWSIKTLAEMEDEYWKTQGANGLWGKFGIDDVAQIQGDKCGIIHYDNADLRRMCDFVTDMQFSCSQTGEMRSVCTMDVLRAKCKEYGPNTVACDMTQVPNRLVEAIKENLKTCKKNLLDYFVLTKDEETANKAAKVANAKGGGQEEKDMTAVVDRTKFPDELQIKEWSRYGDIAKKMLGIEKDGKNGTSADAKKKAVQKIPHSPWSHKTSVCSSEHVGAMSRYLTCWKHVPPAFADKVMEPRIPDLKMCLDECSAQGSIRNFDKCIDHIVTHSEQVESIQTWRNEGKTPIPPAPDDQGANLATILQASIEQKLKKLLSVSTIVVGEGSTMGDDQVRADFWDTIRDQVRDKAWDEVKKNVQAFQRRVVNKKDPFDDQVKLIVGIVKDFTRESR